MNRIFKGLLGVAVMGAVVATEAAFPLRVDIDVSTKRNTKQIGAGDDGNAKVENVQVRVKIRKSGGQPYTDPLNVELYVIGKQIHTGYFGIIDVVKKEFNFTKENDNTFEFRSQMYALPKTDGNINVGGTYETYLVVVTDKTGKIIDTRSGRVIKERGIAMIREMGKHTLFDRDGNVVGKIDTSGSAVKKAIPAAVRSDSY